jgi:hypothetical protein
MSEHTDPEACYRRGYEQGARDTVKAMQMIPSRPRALALLTEWVEILLHEWRHHDRLSDRSVKPPTPAFDP